MDYRTDVGRVVRHGAIVPPSKKVAVGLYRCSRCHAYLVYEDVPSGSSPCRPASFEGPCGQCWSADRDGEPPLTHYQRMDRVGFWQELWFWFRVRRDWE